jgi:serine/threonine protein kinase
MDFGMSGVSGVSGVSGSTGTKRAYNPTSSSAQPSAIGEGAYGCVFSPAFECYENMNKDTIAIPQSDRSKVVSKVFMEEADANAEFENTALLYQKDPNQDYFYYPQRKCYVNIPKDLQDSSSCSFFNEANKYKQARIKGGTGHPELNPFGFNPNQEAFSPNQRRTPMRTPTRTPPATPPHRGTPSPQTLANNPLHQKRHTPPPKNRASRSQTPPLPNEWFASLEMPKADKTLYKLLTEIPENRRLTRIQFLTICRRLWDGIERLHSPQPPGAYFHRDIKLDNVMVIKKVIPPTTQSSKPKINIETRLIDFGKMMKFSDVSHLKEDALRMPYKFDIVLEPPELRYIGLNIHDPRSLKEDIEELVSRLITVEIEKLEFLGEETIEPFVKNPQYTYSLKNLVISLYNTRTAFEISPDKIDIYDIGLMLLHASKYLNNQDSAALKQAFDLLILGCIMPNPADRYDWKGFKDAVQTCLNTQGASQASIQGGSHRIIKTEAKETIGSRTYTVYKGAHGKKYIRSKGEYIGLVNARQTLRASKSSK